MIIIILTQFVFVLAYVALYKSTSILFKCSLVS